MLTDNETGLPEKKCARSECSKKAYPGQKYCSRDCAPFGKLAGGSGQPFTPNPKLLKGGAQAGSPSPAAATEGPKAAPPSDRAAAAPAEPFEGKFGELVARRRKDVDLELTALRDKTGCYQKYLKGLESGRQDKALVRFLRLAKVLGISLDDLAKRLKVVDKTTQRLEARRKKLADRIAREQRQLSELEEQIGAGA